MTTVEKLAQLFYDYNESEYEETEVEEMIESGEVFYMLDEIVEDEDFGIRARVLEREIIKNMR